MTTDNDDDEVTDAIRAAAAALRTAGGVGRQLLDDGQPVVFLDGDHIIKQHPDGTREVLETLDDGPDSGQHDADQ